MDKLINQDAIEIDLQQLLSILWRKAWLLILVSALAAALAFGYAWFFVTPTYAASAQLYVNNNYVDSPGFSSSQIEAAQNLADTYMVILESRNVLEEVREHTKLDYTYRQLKGMISAAAVNDTEVFEVKVTCDDYQHAAIIANGITAVLPDKIAAVVEGSSVRVVDYATENPNPVGPNYRSYLSMGAVVGFSLCLVVILVLEIMNTTIHSEEYLTQTYQNLPLLTVIPGAESKKSKYYRGYYATPSKRRSSSGKGGTVK